MPNDEMQKNPDELTMESLGRHEEPVALLEDHVESDAAQSPNSTAVVEPLQSAQPPVQLVATVPPATPHSVNTPGVLVLQWLTYAFWGWALVALYWLTALSIGYFVDKSDDSYGWYDANDFLAYALAAVIVLFVIAIVCDVIYSRFEPKHKTGAAMVIMIIHAVIFALCGIGSLIVGVFAFVSTIVGDGSGATTTMITAATMTFLYGVTLVRTLHPTKIKRVTQVYWAVMVVATLIIAGLGIAGPAAYAQRTKGDRAIESGLSQIAYAVNEYTTGKGELPESLKNINLNSGYYSDSDSVQQLIDDNLVTYKPKEQLKTSDFFPARHGSDISTVFHYQLCVTYSDSKGNSTYNDYSSSGNQKYDTTPHTSDHSAGYVCYDLQTDYAY